MISPTAQSAPMRELLQMADRAAQSDANVLITGESGAGKDVLAAFIHACGGRRTQPLVRIDCAALPKDLLEAELFGYERGAFTGAFEARPGRFEAAHHGTLALDEIAYLTTDAQAKLLRVLETREFVRLGGRKIIKVDARLIATTNVDLEAAIKRRLFREDLYYRLNVLHLRVPPLRERAEDIAPLADEIIAACAAKHGREVHGISSEALEILQRYDFPGNVRELSNALERAVVIAHGRRVEQADLPDAFGTFAEHQRRGRPQTLAELEADYVAEILRLTKGNKTAAARILGISRKNLYEKIARYNLSDGNSPTGSN